MTADGNVTFLVVLGHAETQGKDTQTLDLGGNTHSAPKKTGGGPQGMIVRDGVAQKEAPREGAI